jgi:hypothetical protein
MWKRWLQLGAALLVGAGIAWLIYLVGFSRRAEWPRFIVWDYNRSGEAVAVYLNPRVLKKYDVSPKEFEAAYRAFTDGAAKAIAAALAEMFFEPSKGTQDRQTESQAEQDELPFKITPAAFREILESARIECWAVKADGTYTVTEELHPKAGVSQDQSPALRGGKSGVRFSVPPTTLEEAKRTFARDTGITWPDVARDVRFDEHRVPLLGDGVFYVVFNVPPKLMQEWLDLPPPWKRKEWLAGPIPVEVGCNCGFGFESPSGWSAKEGGPKEYSGGASEVLAILKSKAVRYVARDRGPTGNPWYSGDLLILDPETGTVRYCSWDR